MDEDKFAQQIAAERERVAALHRLTAESPLLLHDQLTALTAIEEFQTALEGLQVAEEEQLRHQTEELAVAHEAAEAEHQRYQTERKRAREERVRAQARQQYLEHALEHEREIVQALMKDLLGKQPPIPGLEVASIYHPASRLDHVGGDYFDFIALSRHRMGVVIGDVCGKGLAAARYTAMVKYMLRAYARQEPSPDILLPRLNDALYDEMCDDPIFVTLFYGVLDLEAGALTYANAGHPPPVRYDVGSRRCEHLEATGIVLGAMPTQEYRQQSLSFERGAVLALMTDGVTEAAPPLEDQGMCAILQDRRAENAEVIAQAIFGQMWEHAGGELRDDVAIVVARRT